MKRIILLYILLLLLCITSSNIIAQQKSQTLSFDLDTSTLFQKTKDILDYADTINDFPKQILLIDAHKRQAITMPYTPTGKAFSLSFWFQITDNQSYPLIYQIQSDHAQKVQKYIEIGINKQKIYIKDNYSLKKC